MVSWWGAAGKGANRSNVDTAVEAARSRGCNRVTELIQQSTPARVEVVVGLQNESRPIPLTMHILVPQPVGELLGDVTRRNCPNVSVYTVRSQNYSIHVSYASVTQLVGVTSPLHSLTGV